MHVKWEEFIYNLVKMGCKGLPSRIVYKMKTEVKKRNNIALINSLWSHIFLLDVKATYI